MSNQGGGGGQSQYGGFQRQPQVGQQWGGQNFSGFRGFGTPFQSNKMGVQGYGGLNTSPPPTQPPPPTEWGGERVISDPAHVFGFGGQPTPPTQYQNDARQIGSFQDPNKMMQQQAQNIGGWGGLQKQFNPVAQDSVGANKYMQNGQFDRGAAVNDYYGALDKLRSQGVSGQINLYDQFKGADGSYTGPFNNAMIADYAGGFQTPGAMGNWTGKRNGKNYWLGTELDDHQFNERFKQGV